MSYLFSRCKVVLACVGHPVLKVSVLWLQIKWFCLTQVAVMFMRRWTLVRCDTLCAAKEVQLIIPPSPWWTWCNFHFSGVGMGSIALIIHPFPHPKIFLWGSLVQEKMWSNGHIVHEGSYPTPGTMLWVEIENPSTSNKWAPGWIYSDATQHVLIQITWSNYTVQPIITVVRLKTRFSEGMKLKCKSSEDHMPYWTLLLWVNTI